MSSSGPASNWGAWIQQGVAQIRDAKLERVLRPLIPTQSAVEVSWGPFGVVGGSAILQHTSCNTTASLLLCPQVYIHESELQAWLDGQPSPDALSDTSSGTTGWLVPHQHPHHQQQHNQQHTQQQQQQSLPEVPGYRRLVLFSLNDYLGLSTHPHVRSAAAAAAQQVRTAATGISYVKPTRPCRATAAVWQPPSVLSRADMASLVCLREQLEVMRQTNDLLPPVPLNPPATQVGSGPRSSALVGGFTAAHRQLELALARLKGTQDALLFPTGFAANTAVVSVLAAASSSSSTRQHHQQQRRQQEPKVVIFSDELNHASIIDGARLACRGPGSVLQVYRHNDLRHLAQLLEVAPARARKLVVTDSLFSMDGDYADLQVCGRVGLIGVWGLCGV